MALLGVDLGERRIGLAVAEGEPPRAVPLTTLPRRASVAADVADLARIVTERGIVELVIGLPFEASGIEGPQARSTRAWADEVGRLLALPLAYRDERLTSHLAEGRVGAAKRGSLNSSNRMSAMYRVVSRPTKSSSVNGPIG